MAPQQSTEIIRKYWKHIAITVLFVVYLAVNLFHIGGDAFVTALNNNIANPMALAVTLMALLSWQQITFKGQNRMLWSGLTIGWALWTIAEFYWGIAAFVGKEVPYPSWADFFWIVGYIPMSLALWRRIRSLPQKISPTQKTGMWAAILVSIGWTIVFVLIPIARSDSQAAFLVSALNLLYPLVDLVLLSLVLRALSAYQKGMYGHVWGWFSAGFILHSLSGLFFSYASAAGLYYPDGQVNFVSTFGVDIPYNTAYLLWLVGLYLLIKMQRRYRIFTEIETTPALVPNTHLLISTRADHTIIDVSRNYIRLFSMESANGKTLTAALGISAEDADAILRDTQANGTLKERAVLVKTHSGKQKGRISGISIVNPQGEYVGVALLLRLFNEDYRLDEWLTDDQKGMVRSLLSKTGTDQREEEEIKHLLSNYTLAHLKSFYNRVFSEGGSIMADAFIAELKSVARQHGWSIVIHPNALLDVSALTLAETRVALPVLMEGAKQFVARIIDQPTVDAIAKDLHARFDETTLKNLAYFD